MPVITSEPSTKKCGKGQVRKKGRCVRRKRHGGKRPKSSRQWSATVRARAHPPDPRRPGGDGRPRRARRRHGGRRLHDAGIRSDLQRRRRDRAGGRAWRWTKRRTTSTSPTRPTAGSRSSTPTGNFLFMFGDGVNETTGGNKCPVSPSDSCGPGQQSSPTFPDFTNPSAIAVDNSDSPSKGDVYVAEGIRQRRTRDDLQVRQQRASSFRPGARRGRWPSRSCIRMTVSPFTGDVWVLDGYATTRDRQQGRRLRLTRATAASSTKRGSDPAGDGDFAVDSDEHFWVGNQNRFPMKVAIEQFPVNGQTPARGSSQPSPAQGWATNPANSDVLTVLNDEAVNVFERTCEPAKGFCTPKESFGAGQLPVAEGARRRRLRLLGLRRGRRRDRGLPLETDPRHHTQTGLRRPERRGPHRPSRSDRRREHHRLRSRIRADQFLRVDGSL